VEAATGRSYIPSVTEFIVSAGLVAVGMTIFVLACKYLAVFPEGPVVEVEKKKMLEAGVVPGTTHVRGVMRAFDRS
jgi:Ni/Fe-hydrogenase subunit HybB-like protein